jgi:hypothetical protein
MRKIWLLTMLMITAAMTASATTYYVDPAGSNANPGTSPQTAWRTLLKVGLSTFNPGDVILFKRDAVWNEWLTPPSSGTAGNLIKFDAYGNGRPPEFTGFYQTTASNWTNTSGNVWQATLTATQAISQLKFVRFGTVWGNAQTSQAALANDRDWYYDATSQILYVWSEENPVTHYGAVNPIILSGQSLINLNNVDYVEVQHIELDWYDTYGVQVQGTSDHIWLANIAADSQVPNAAVPIGFYFHPADGTDIHIFNTDSHRNYKGYEFNGTASAYELKNCRAYANRTYGLVDNTGAVTYDYCHFYANNIATGVSTDVTGTPGPIDGGHNVPADTAPNVRGFMEYPARITLTFDDPGLLDGPHEYIAPLLPMFQAKGVPLSIATVTGYDLSNQLIPTFQSWINAGFDLNVHSVSHQYFVFPNAFTIQYTGTAATSVTLSISGKHLTITAPGDPSAQVSWDLTTPAPGQASNGLDTLGGVIATLNQRGVFAVTADSNMKTAVKSEDLSDVAATDIKSASLLLTMDKTRLMTDELGWSKQWMNQNLTGLFGHHSVTLTWNAPSGTVPDYYNVYRSATSGTGYSLLATNVASMTYTDFAVNPQQTWFYETTAVAGGMESSPSNEVEATVPGHWVYVYPGSYEDTSTEAIAVAAGYAGARGSGVMQPSPEADTVMGTGIDVQNILSQGSVPYFQNITDAQFVNKLRALVFKSAVWGVPMGIFWHWNELTPDQVAVMVDALKSAGATLMSNTQLVDYLVSKQQNAGTTNYVAATTGVPDFRVGAGSPEVDAGVAVGNEYKFDLMGNDQSLFGARWEIGASAYVPESLGTVK